VVRSNSPRVLASTFLARRFARSKEIAREKSRKASAPNVKRLACRPAKAPVGRSRVSRLFPRPNRVLALCRSGKNCQKDGDHVRWNLRESPRSADIEGVANYLQELGFLLYHFLLGLTRLFSNLVSIGDSKSAKWT